jgi:hypothetical protein
MRQPDDPEAIAERKRAFREYLERIEIKKRPLAVRPLIREVPTHEDLERARRILAGERVED